MARLRSPFFARIVLGCLAITIFSAQCAQAYHPKHPDVKGMVNAAIRYLSADHPNQGYTKQMGGAAIIGLAILKAGRPKTHAKVQHAVKVIREELKRGFVDNYNGGIATIFLCELDHQKYAPEITQLIKLMMNAQRKDGSWSYRAFHVGDTSQTQYAALCMWYANKAGYGHLVPKDSVADMANWLLRTQDVTGSFGYHPEDPGTFERKDQSKTRENGQLIDNFTNKHSDFSAGLSALYCAADLLGFAENPPVKKKKRDPSLGTELKEIKQKQPGQKAIRKPGALNNTNVNINILRKGLNDAMGWFSRNYAVKTDRWQYYYLYGLERFMSYREMINNNIEKEPRWYNDGVEFLKKAQDASGCWGAREKGTGVVNTAFAVLFLMRSTKKTLGNTALFEDNGLVAKLPRTLGNVGADGTINEQKRDENTETLITELLNNKADDRDFEIKVTGKALLSDSEAKRREQVKKLQALVRKGTYNKRRAAVKILATSGKVDDQTVSLIIYALTDPDYRVVNEARDSLRFISRKIDGFGLKRLKSNTEVKAKKEDLARVVESWKQWYRTIRPKAKFTVFNEK